MYLFQNMESETIMGTFPGTMITGSSNLSVTGLRNRLELNVILRNKTDYEAGKNVFDELWDTAISVVDGDTIDTFKDRVIKHIWFEKLYAPYKMFVRVLHEYFNIPTDENILTDPGGYYRRHLFQSEIPNRRGATGTELDQKS